MVTVWWEYAPYLPAATCKLSEVCPYYRNDEESIHSAHVLQLAVSQAKNSAARGDMKKFGMESTGNHLHKFDRQFGTEEHLHLHSKQEWVPFRIFLRGPFSGEERDERSGIVRSGGIDVRVSSEDNSWMCANGNVQEFWTAMSGRDNEH
jgi:hypothetical protein